MKRYIFIPSAIGTKEGFSELFDNTHEGSYSLNTNWTGILKNSKLKVNVMPLEKFINMVPERFEFIEHIKVDCEGNDIDVIKSAGKSIEKVAVITTEQRDDNFFKGIGFIFLESQNGGYSYINKKFKHLHKKLDYFIRV